MLRLAGSSTIVAGQSVFLQGDNTGSELLEHLKAGQGGVGWGGMPLRLQCAQAFRA
jgi:hypothetical protein